MLRKSMYVFICALIFTVVLMSSNGFATEKALAATSYDLSGIWDIVTNNKVGTINITNQSGNEFSGTVHIDAGYTEKMINGRITGDTVSFTRKWDRDLRQDYTGTLSVDANGKATIKGKFTQNGAGSYNWSASKSSVSISKEGATAGQNLRATAGNKQVCLTWNAVADKQGLIGYHLFRGTGSGKETTTPVTDFPIKDTSYNDPNVFNGTTYCYIMRPVYSSGMGTVSNEACATPSATAACGGQKAAGSGTEGKTVDEKGNPILPGGIGTIILSINNPYMTVNGAQREIDPGRGTVPIVYNGRTLLPIAAVIEAAGGTVKWLAAEKKVTIEQKGTIIDLWIDKNETLINGKPGMTDVAPIIKNSRTMLPLRFIADNLGAKVDWDGVSYKVTIQFK